MQVKITLNIPNWLYRFRWKNIKNYVAYHLHPYRCLDCRKKLPFNRFEIAGKVGVQQLTVEYDKTVCPTCLDKRITALENSPDFTKKQRSDRYNVHKTCEVCCEPKASFRWLRMGDGIIDNLRYCTQGSWNGHYVCLSCTHTTIRTGKMGSTIFSWYNGKTVPVNQLGLPVVDDKVKFPQK